MASRRLLLTAFGPFPETPYNPTPKLAQRLAARLSEGEDHLPGWSIERRTLDTNWRAPPELLADVSRAEHVPDMILGLGVSGRADSVRVERWALNEATGNTPDVAGKLAETKELSAGRPPRLEGRLHMGALEEVTRAAQRAGHPVVFSDDAGTYLCNALFYHLLDGFEGGEGTPLVGFVHVPAIWGSEVAPGPGLPEEVVVEVLVALVSGWCRVVEVGGSGVQPVVRHGGDGGTEVTDVTRTQKKGSVLER